MPGRQGRASRGSCPRGMVRQAVVQVAVSEPGAPEAMKPAVVLAPAPREPFHSAFVSTLPLSELLHACVMVAPPTVTFQPRIAAEPAVTVTSPCQPPDHVFAALTVAVQAPPGAGVGVGVGVNRSEERRVGKEC